MLLLAAVAYVMGSIPFGLIVGRLKGIDPRTAGSRNIGATNVGRLLGGRYFAIVFLLDMLKGMLPMVAGGLIIHNQPPSHLHFVLWLMIGFAAIAGHMFSLFLGFKGGKGVATGAGVALGVFPYFTFPALVALLAFAAVVFITRIVSLASMTGAVILPIAYVVIGWFLKWDVFGTQLPLLIFAVLLCGLIIYRHRANIARLRAGTEPKFVSQRRASNETDAGVQK
jgi:glycerol-3-phosphate acyltransferase PlsY